MGKKAEAEIGRRIYDEAFRREAVRILTVGGRTVPQVVADLGIGRSTLDRPAFNRTRLKAEKSIGSRVLEQLIRVQVDAGCSRRVEI